jgi:acetyl-CoA synthetase
VWQLGAIYVPLFSGFRDEALRIRLEDSGTKTVVTDLPNRENLARVQDGGLDIEVLVIGEAKEEGDRSFEKLLDRADLEVQIAETTLDDPATIMYTSGTTGRPKGCVLPHRGVLNLWPYVINCLALEEEDLLFSTADPGWSFGLYTTGFAPLSLGKSRLLYEADPSPTGWWGAVSKHEVTHLAGAPTGFRQLAAAGEEAMGEGHVPLRAATSAGEPLDPEVIHWFQEHVGVTVYDSYGLTELGMVIANLRQGEGATEPEPGSMGFPVPGFDIRLVDEDHQPVSTGDVGQVAVRDNGFFLSSGYWGREEEWNRRLQDGWWVTEDLAYCDDGGRFWYVGRSDDVIISAGYTIGPFDVESVLLEHPLIVDVACVGEPDQRKGQVVAAHVVLSEEATGDLTEELRQWAGEHLGWYAAPRQVYVHSELPRTESGKIKRKELAKSSR